MAIATLFLLVAVFVGSWIAFVNIVRGISTHSVPPINFALVALCITYIFWYYQVRT